MKRKLAFRLGRVPLLLAIVFCAASAMAISNLEMRTYSDDRSPAPAKPEPDQPPPKVQVIKEVRAVLRNSSKQTIAGAQVSFWVFVRNVGDPAIKVGGMGTKAVDLPPGQWVTVVSDPLLVEMQPAGRWVGGKVEKSGASYRGYGVRVTVNGEVLADYFSTPTYRDIADAPPPGGGN